MSTFSQIKSVVRSNLNDAGVSFYSAADLIDSLQDGYDDVFFNTRCLIKKVTLNFHASPYYDFKLLGVSDFMCVIGIFNNNTNRWLMDDVTVRDLDKFRLNWELWEGEAEQWCPVNFDLNVLIPAHSIPTGNFDLYYAAVAPFIDDDSATPLIATDCQNLLENYVTGDLLEQAEEYIKATKYFELYFQGLENYSSRVKNLARRDLLMRI